MKSFQLFLRCWCPAAGCGYDPSYCTVLDANTIHHGERDREHVCIDWKPRPLLFLLSEHHHNYIRLHHNSNTTVYNNLCSKMKSLDSKSVHVLISTRYIRSTLTWYRFFWSDMACLIVCYVSPYAMLFSLLKWSIFSSRRIRRWTVICLKTTNTLLLSSREEWRDLDSVLEEEENFTPCPYLCSEWQLTVSWDNEKEKMLTLSLQVQPHRMADCRLEISWLRSMDRQPRTWLMETP